MRRPCLLIARVIIARIHNDAYVENFTPLSGSNLSTALMRPMAPSCFKSSKDSPYLRYLLAMGNTKPMLAFTKRFLSEIDSGLLTTCSNDLGPAVIVLPIKFILSRSDSSAISGWYKASMISNELHAAHTRHGKHATSDQIRHRYGFLRLGRSAFRSFGELSSFNRM